MNILHWFELVQTILHSKSWAYSRLRKSSDRNIAEKCTLYDCHVKMMTYEISYRIWCSVVQKTGDANPAGSYTGYRTRSNLWNVLIIGTQDFNHSNSWKEWIFEKTNNSNLRTGNFYSFPCIIFLARATNILHLGIFNPPWLSRRLPVPRTRVSDWP